ncbi:MAG: hypothetical protein C4519_17075 [Desulfobacteraceae bacterium]|nr:MAG: hypothetical protein C4519_17075 [Desulfobacteraceae bacterium]
MSVMDEERFLVERIGNVARCTLNHPANMNAMGPEMGEPMLRGIDGVMVDDSIRVIVIRGSGGNFCSGSDLSLLGDHMDPAYLRGLMNSINQLLLKLHHGPKPVISEVDGYAVGGGLGLALASDMTLASERAKLCAGFIRIGAVPDMGVTYFLTERVGMARAKEIAFTGDVLDAQTALSIGLINRIVPHEEISEAVMQLAARIAKAPADALSWTKRNLNRATHLDLQTVMDLEAHIQPLMLLSEAHRAAIKKLFP